MIPIENETAKKILVVGELVADLISTEDIASLATPHLFVTSQGGSAANVCANLKWMGIDATLIASVGADGLGTYLINELKAIGLSTQHISCLQKHQTSVIFVGKNNATPDFIAYRNADKFIQPLEDTLISDCAILHTTAFALSKQPARSQILKAIKKVYKANGLLSVDWNFASPIWEDDDGMEVFELINTKSTLLKISMDDLHRFTGKQLSIAEAISWLNRLQMKVICLTCGKQGVWFKTDDSSWTHKPALTAKAAIGVTGAGDAFWAGFLAQILKRDSIESSIDHALFIARQKVELPYPLYKQPM
jgi:fructokinase